MYLLLLVLCLPLAAWSQSAQLATVHFSPNQGLPSSEVYDLLQDQKGFLWIATDNGVSRFNGYQFDNFGFGQGLSENVILSLVEDATGNIWMASISGNLYYYQAYTIRPFPHNAVIQRHNDANGGITNFHVDAQQTVYLSTQYQILKIDSSGQAQRLHRGRGYHIYPIEDQFIYNVIAHSRFQDNPPTDEERVDFWLHREGRWLQKTFPLPPKKIKRFRHGRIMSSPSGKLLFSHNADLFTLSPTLKFTHTQSPDDIIAMTVLHDGRVLAGLVNRAEGGGLLVFPDDDHLSPRDAERYLPHYSISAVLEDEAYGLWFASNESGIFYCPNPELRIYNTTTGLSSNYVRAISTKDTAAIFIGTDDGKVYQLDLHTQSLDLVLELDEEIHDLQYDTLRQTLWVGSIAEALPNQFAHQGTKPFDLRLVPSKKFQLFPSGKLLGTQFGTNGTYQYQVAEDQVLTTDSVPPFPSQRAFCVYEDFRGNVWVGRSGGLYQYHRDTLLRIDHEHPAFRLRIEDMLQLADSTFVLGTKGAGILLWKGAQIVQIDKDDGLTSNMVEKIYLDEAQNIWVSTLNGLNQLLRQQNGHYQINRYTTANGLPSNEITDLTFAGEAIWIATPQGLAYLPHYQAISPGTNRQPIIQAVLVNNENYPGKAGHALPHWKSNIEFRYFTFDYTQNGNIHYRYRLRPSDAWSYSQDLAVNYAALAPGAYQFELQSANTAGRWSPSTRYSFAISPPFWKTAWFIGLAILSLGLLLLGLYRYQVRQIKIKANFERDLQNLRQAALRAQMHPHFIFNCLNSIQGFIIANDRRTATDYLARFARLIRSILNTSQEKLIPIEAEVALLKDNTFLENLRMEQPFEFNLSIDPKIDTFELRIPPLLTQPLIENAIIHGLSTSPRRGKIEIAYQLAERFLQISVRDNGVGLADSQAGQQSSLHQSMGVDLIRKRLELQNQGFLSKPFIAFGSLRGRAGWQYGTEVTIKVYTGDPGTPSVR